MPSESQRKGSWQYKKWRQEAINKAMPGYSRNVTSWDTLPSAPTEAEFPQIILGKGITWTAAKQYEKQAREYGKEANVYFKAMLESLAVAAVAVDKDDISDELDVAVDNAIEAVSCLRDFNIAYVYSGRDTFPDRRAYALAYTVKDFLASKIVTGTNLPKDILAMFKSKLTREWESPNKLDKKVKSLLDMFAMGATKPKKDFPPKSWEKGVDAPVEKKLITDAQKLETEAMHLLTRASNMATSFSHKITNTNEKPSNIKALAWDIASLSVEAALLMREALYNRYKAGETLDFKIKQYYDLPSFLKYKVGNLVFYRGRSVPSNVIDARTMIADAVTKDWEKPSKEDRELLSAFNIRVS